MSEPKPLEKEVEDILKPKPLNLRKIEKELLEIYYNKWDKNRIDEEFIKLTVSIFKNRIKKTCEFYLRYKDNPELFLKEHPEFEDKLATFCKAYKNGRCEGEHRTFCKPSKCLFFFELVDIEKYNSWLFKLAFKDVLEG